MVVPQGLLKTFQSKENSHLKLSKQYLGHHFKSIYQKSAKFDEVPWQAKARLRFRTLGLLRLLKVILYLSKIITVCSTLSGLYPRPCYQ